MIQKGQDILILFKNPYFKLKNGAGAFNGIENFVHPKFVMTNFLKILNNQSYHKTDTMAKNLTKVSKFEITIKNPLFLYFYDHKRFCITLNAGWVKN